MPALAHHSAHQFFSPCIAVTYWLCMRMCKSDIIWLFRAHISYSSFPAARKTVSVLCWMTSNQATWRILHEKLPGQVLIYQQALFSASRFLDTSVLTGAAGESNRVSRCLRTLRTGQSLSKHTITQLQWVRRIVFEEHTQSQLIDCLCWCKM